MRLYTKMALLILVGVWPVSPLWAQDFEDVLPASRSSVLAGGTFYLLQPRFSDNVAYTRFTAANPAANAVTAGNSGQEFDWRLQPAFAGWFGYLSGEGLGVRARYFQFEQASRTLQASLTEAEAGAKSTITVPNFDLPGVGSGVSAFGSPGTLLAGVPPLGQDNLQFVSRLDIQAIDIEALYRIDAQEWNFLYSGGGRYLRLHQRYDARLSNPGVGGATETQSLQFDREYNGGGPTLALEATRQICQSHFAFFAVVRGSLIFGECRQDAVYAQKIDDPEGVSTAGAQSTLTQSTRSTTRTIPVGEIELGLQYNAPIGRHVVFVRAGFVGQTYFDAGSASQTTGNLSLLGGQMSLGINY